MDPQRQREIASEGGKAAHQKGTAHEFTSEEAKRAGSMSHGNRQSAQTSVRGSAQSGNRQEGSKQEGSKQEGSKQEGSKQGEQPQAGNKQGASKQSGGSKSR